MHGVRFLYQFCSSSSAWFRGQRRLITAASGVVQTAAVLDTPTGCHTRSTVRAGLRLPLTNCTPRLPSGRLTARWFI